MPSLVKIGRTAGTSEERARALSSTTGVPTPYVVVYDELVLDAAAVEKRMHQRFAIFRVNTRREHFEIPIKQAVRALQEEAVNFGLSRIGDTHQDVTETLRRRFGPWLKPKLLNVWLAQFNGAVYLETVEGPAAPISPEELVAAETDLQVLGGDLLDPAWPGESFYFLPSDPVSVNAEKFLDLDDHTLFMITDLFTEQAAYEAGLIEDDEPWYIGYEGMWVNDPLRLIERHRASPQPAARSPQPAALGARPAALGARPAALGAKAASSPRMDPATRAAAPGGAG